MTQSSTQQITRLGEAFASHKNISHWRVSFLLRGNGKFLENLKQGASCTLKTHEKCILWFSDNWPVDLEWPTGIPRPENTAEDAA